MSFFMREIYYMNRFVLYCLPFFLFSSFSVLSAESKMPKISGFYQSSFENILLPSSEEMGLLGANYLLEANNWYVGLGIYGAVTGKRGGFFTGGLHLGKHIPLFNGFFLDGNAFVGGGGGGSAPQGGGLMLRAAAGAGKQVGGHRYFIGVSRVSFPNGDINSDQVSLAYSYRFSALHFSGWMSESERARWSGAFKQQAVYSQQLSMQISNYFPSDAVKGRNGLVHQSVLGVMGIRFSQKLTNALWGEFETGGAMSGGIDGFAQVLGGLSAKHLLTQRLTLSGGWLVGAAGGGNVDTGGGVITRAYTGVEVALSPRWHSYFHLGYITALDGEFSAKTINLNLAYQFQNISSAKAVGEVFGGEKIKWRKLRIRPGVQRYTGYAGNGRKFQGQKNLDVDLVNLKLDAFVNKTVFFTGQALGAFDGKAGGYAVGFLGPGIQFNRYLGVELLVGVAGGGGIAVGSGKIVQPMINLELPHSKQWSSEISAGYITAVDGKLSAYVFNAGLVYRFSQPYF